MKRIGRAFGIGLIFALLVHGRVFAQSAAGPGIHFNAAFGLAGTMGKHASAFGQLCTLGVEIEVPLWKGLAIQPELHLGLGDFGFFLPGVLLDYDIQDFFIGAGFAFPSLIAHSGFGSLSPAGKLHAGYRAGRWSLSGYWLTTSLSDVHYALIGGTVGYRF